MRTEITFYPVHEERRETFENGVIETGTVSNTIDNNLKKNYYEMFGGK